MCTNRGRGGGAKGGGGANNQKQTEQNRVKKMFNNPMLKNPLVSGLPESERGDFYYHRDYASGEMISEYGRGKIITNGDNINTKNVLVNINFPNITGTEKQINYAKNLITKQLRKEIERATDASKGKESEFIEAAKRADPSVKTYSDAINLALKRKKNTVLSFLSSNSSARAIIDKYGY